MCFSIKKNRKVCLRLSMQASNRIVYRMFYHANKHERCNLDLKLLFFNLKINYKNRKNEVKKNMLESEDDKQLTNNFNFHNIHVRITIKINISKSH